MNLNAWDRDEEMSIVDRDVDTKVRLSFQRRAGIYVLYRGLLIHFSSDFIG